MNPNIKHSIRIINMLMDHELSSKELATQMSVSQSTTRSWLRALHAAQLVHIVEWRRTTTGNPCIAVYSWGRGKDVKRPQKQTMAQKTANYRKREHMKLLLGRPIHQAPVRTQ